MSSAAQNQVRTPLPSLETNLHKILARKIADSEEVSFRKAKLLTKAYYKLLRESATPLVDPQVNIYPPKARKIQKKYLYFLGSSHSKTQRRRRIQFN